MQKLMKLVVFVPSENADDVRRALGEVGAGKIGDYSFCSFSSRGTGRFLPGDGTEPAVGKPGTLEAVEEERIEVTCEESLLNRAVQAVKDVHPYEEVVIDIYPTYALETS
jgi:hypothetical protein